MGKMGKTHHSQQVFFCTVRIGGGRGERKLPVTGQNIPDGAQYLAIGSSYAKADVEETI